MIADISIILASTLTRLAHIPEAYLSFCQMKQLNINIVISTGWDATTLQVRLSVALCPPKICQFPFILLARLFKCQLMLTLDYSIPVLASLVISATYKITIKYAFNNQGLRTTLS